ncbi:MAG: HAD-IC family P-type ATPase [Eubacteriales bacterium]|nr:HAD-IC family P-type ATPase [Eubacteriales bacterium]
METFSLDSRTVEERKTVGAVNRFELKANRRTKDIIIANIFTLFNCINLILGGLVIFTGSYRNLLFLLVIVINTAIGIYQEIKAKRILDDLSLLVAAKVRVVRDEQITEVPPDEVVVGEYIHLKTGEQIVCDGKLVSGHLEVDESLLTGESDMITKNVGDALLSGSFVTSDTGIMQVEKVGADNYINRLAERAKVFRKHPSKLRDSLNFILKMASFLIAPIGVALFIKGYFIMGNPLNDTILRIVAALVGMIAEGLILLTSVSLAVSSIQLARKRILVQELFCIETLARVDTLCFDKTGTITTGEMRVAEITGDASVSGILGDYVRAFGDMNTTATAIAKYTEGTGKRTVTATLPFSSRRKYSAVAFKGEGTYVMGAFEYLYPTADAESYPVMHRALAAGKRVLTLGWTDRRPTEEFIGTLSEPTAFIILEDEIRPNTNEIFEYFRSQDVDIKIISGDNHISVLEIAKRAGLAEDGRAVDVSAMTDDELRAAVDAYQVFGRVKPEQKKLMVQTLKEAGHKVAMSGDGVNDVLALKEADISVAMANGSAAAKQIANIVLLNGDFSNFYAILMEGRRVINNIQKVASLFLVKTFYSAAIALLSIFTTLIYPFLPIQLTLISTLTVGTPSFFITFERSKERIKDNFIREVFTRSGISAARLVAAVIVVNMLHLEKERVGDLIVILTLLNGILMLHSVLKPFNRYKTGLFALIIGLSMVAVTVFAGFFSLSILSVWDYLTAGIMMTLIYFSVEWVYQRIVRVNERVRGARHRNE